jgi:hypothetical protein
MPHTSSMRTDQDLNTTIANMERSYTNQAETAKQKAERCEAQAEAAHGEEYKRMHREEAAGYRETERRFTERAAVAKEGFLLVDTSDNEFMLANQPLISRACSEKRVRFVKQGDRGPLPIQPGVQAVGLPGYDLKRA